MRGAQFSGSGLWVVFWPTISQTSIQLANGYGASFSDFRARKVDEICPSSLASHSSTWLAMTLDSPFFLGPKVSNSFLEKLVAHM